MASNKEIVIRVLRGQGTDSGIPQRPGEGPGQTVPGTQASSNLLSQLAIASSIQQRSVVGASAAAAQQTSIVSPLTQGEVIQELVRSARNQGLGSVGLTDDDLAHIANREESKLERARIAAAYREEHRRRMNKVRFWRKNPHTHQLEELNPALSPLKTQTVLTEDAPAPSKSPKPNLIEELHRFPGKIPGIDDTEVVTGRTPDPFNPELPAIMPKPKGFRPGPGKMGIGPVPTLADLQRIKSDWKTVGRGISKGLQWADTAQMAGVLNLGQSAPDIAKNLGKVLLGTPGLKAAGSGLNNLLGLSAVAKTLRLGGFASGGAILSAIAILQLGGVAARGINDLSRQMESGTSFGRAFGDVTLQTTSGILSMADSLLQTSNFTRLGLSVLGTKQIEIDAKMEKFRREYLTSDADIEAEARVFREEANKSKEQMQLALSVAAAQKSVEYVARWARPLTGRTAMYSSMAGHNRQLWEVTEKQSKQWIQRMVERNIYTDSYKKENEAIIADERESVR